MEVVDLVFVYVQVRRGEQVPIVARQAPRLEGGKRRRGAEEGKEGNLIQEGCSAFAKLHDEGCLKILRSAYGFLDTARPALSFKCPPASRSVVLIDLCALFVFSCVVSPFL